MNSVYDIFPRMILEHGNDLRSGEMHRGKFISMYLQETRSVDHDENDIWLKYPQFVSKQKDDVHNNWLDYTLRLENEYYEEFKRGLEHE